jgi:hypothetical protein
MRHAQTLVGALCLFALVACSSGSDDSGRTPERVPIPDVTLPQGQSFDKAAWLEMWREIPGTPERGLWRLEPVAGRNRGCFEFQL